MGSDFCDIRTSRPRFRSTEAKDSCARATPWPAATASNAELESECTEVGLCFGADRHCACNHVPSRDHCVIGLCHGHQCGAASVLHDQWHLQLSLNQLDLLTAPAVTPSSRAAEFTEPSLPKLSNACMARSEGRIDCINILKDFAPNQSI